MLVVKRVDVCEYDEKMDAWLLVESKEHVRLWYNDRTLCFQADIFQGNHWLPWVHIFSIANAVEIHSDYFRIRCDPNREWRVYVS